MYIKSKTEKRKKIIIKITIFYIRCSSYKSKGAGSAKRFNRTTKDFLKKLVFQKVNDNWLHETTAITYQYNIKKYFDLNQNQFKLL